MTSTNTTGGCLQALGHDVRLMAAKYVRSVLPQAEERLQRCPDDCRSRDDVTLKTRCRGPAFFAYADYYLIDVKFGIIMNVETSRAIRQAEVGAAKTTIERTEECFDIKSRARVEMLFVPPLRT